MIACRERRQTHSVLEGLLLFREGKGEGLLDVSGRRAQRSQGGARQRPRQHAAGERHSHGSVPGLPVDERGLKAANQLSQYL